MNEKKVYVKLEVKKKKKCYVHNIFFLFPRLTNE